MKKMLIVGIVSILFLSGMLTVTAVIPPPEWESELIAGQDWENPVGTLVINHNDGDRYLYITYSTTDEWIITETHLAVALSLEGIPHTKSGSPKIGHFPYDDPAVSEPTLVEYIVDLNDFPCLEQNGYSGTLYIAAHAVVYHPIYGEETAWADTISQCFPGNSWALYFTITL